MLAAALKNLNETDGGSGRMSNRAAIVNSL
jgi:hypothetical protein